MRKPSWTPDLAQKRRERRARCAAEGLCVLCGSREADRGVLVCSVCREKHNRCTDALRRRRLDAGLCTVCGRAPNIEGLSYCVSCQELHAKKQREDRRRHGRRMRRDANRRYGRLARRGLCTRCGKERPADGRLLCARCAEMKNAQQRRARSMAKAAGICAACMKVPARKGFSLCLPCALRASMANRAYNIRRRARLEAEAGTAEAAA